MLDLSDWHVGIRLVVLLIPAAAALSGLAIDGHIAISRHYQVMCDSFSRSSALNEEQRFSGEFGLKSRFLVIAGMTTPLMLPRLFIRRGTLHPDDYRQFPRYLKRRMKLAMVLMVSGLVLAAVVMNFFKL
ncbi:hypothetical protein [Pseudomonas sp. p21]|uniref:hypothetical protein n=1 Tax=Pseudomonas sp. p21 TaxID=1825979 RepID=UPI0007C852AD|nr:hypothetical protein [Pseudomonas sp. p21]